MFNAYKMDGSMTASIINNQVNLHITEWFYDRLDFY